MKNNLFLVLLLLSVLNYIQAQTDEKSAISKITNENQHNNRHIRHKTSALKSIPPPPQRLTSKNRAEFASTETLAVKTTEKKPEIKIQNVGLQTSLPINTQPSGAAIYINRRQTSHKTPYILQLDTDTRKQKKTVVGLKLAGYEIEVIDVNLHNTELIELKNIRFKKIEQQKLKNEGKATDWQKKQAEMTLIPAGKFQMGMLENDTAEWIKNTHPVHTVELDTFSIDTYEVTIKQYKEFISATGHRPLPDWVNKYSPTDNHPVVGVSWYDANTYAKWMGQNWFLVGVLPSKFQRDRVQI